MLFELHRWVAHKNLLIKVFKRTAPSLECQVDLATYCGGSDATIKFSREIHER